MKKKLSITMEMETVSKLLAALSKKRKQFPSKSEFIEHAINAALQDSSTVPIKTKGADA